MVSGSVEILSVMIYDEIAMIGVVDYLGIMDPRLEWDLSMYQGT